MKRYPQAFLKRLYVTMVRIRQAEESLVEPILHGKIKTPCHLYVGEEAIATGIAAAVTKRDYFFGSHRSHGHYLAKGGSLKALIAEIYGKATGCSRGRGGSMHVISPQDGFMGSVPLVAGTVSLALGAALASRIRKDRRVTVSFFGDGATGEGVLYEALNFAALKCLPIIFACENNLYSTHLPIRECRPDKDIFEIAKPFGITCLKVDGNDILKVYEAAKKAVSLCRQGQGPVFIEFITYRLRGHVGPDDNIQGTHTEIRPPEEVEAWQRKDPIKKFEKVLLDNKILTQEDIIRIWKDAQREVADAHRFAARSLYPRSSELTKYVFA